MRKSKTCVSLLALAAPFGVFPAYAQVDIEPRVEAQAIFTDNVELSPTNKQKDLVLVATPGISIIADRRRSQVRIAYDLAGYFSVDDTSRSEIRHNLNGFAETEVIRDLFSVRANASIGQQFAEIGSAVSGSAGNFNDNRRTVQNYSVTPQLRRELGTFGTATTSYTYGFSSIENRRDNPDERVFVDTHRHRAGGSLASGSRFTRLGWNISGFYDRVERDDGTSFEALEGLLDLSYALGRKIRVVGSVGYEDFEDNTLSRNEEGFIWNAGINVTPGPRSNFEVRAGERFGDTVFSGNFQYRFDARHSINGSYSEDIQVFGRGNIDQIGNVNELPGGVPVDENGIPIDVGTPGFELTNQAFRQKRANLGLTRSSRKVATTVTAFWERRRFSDDVDARIAIGGTGNINYTIDSRQTASLRATYRTTDIIGSPDVKFYSGQAQYEIALSSRATAGARYIYSRRTGGFFGALTENAVALHVRATF